MAISKAIYTIKSTAGFPDALSAPEIYNSNRPASPGSVSGGLIGDHKASVPQAKAFIRYAQMRHFYNATSTTGMTLSNGPDVPALGGYGFIKDSSGVNKRIVAEFSETAPFNFDCYEHFTGNNGQAVETAALVELDMGSGAFKATSGTRTIGGGNSSDYTLQRYNLLSGNGQRGQSGGFYGSALFFAAIPVYEIAIPVFKTMLTEFCAAYSEYLESGGNESSFTDLIVSELVDLCGFVQYFNGQAKDCGSAGIDYTKAGNITKQALMNGKLTPGGVEEGNITFIQDTPTSLTGSAVQLNKNAERGDKFNGKYDLAIAYEEDMSGYIPELNDKIIVPPLADTICDRIVKRRTAGAPLKSFLLYGPAGTGKTTIVSIIAAGLKMPKLTYVCSADTEVIDLIGMLMPVTAADDERGKAVKLEAIIEELGIPDITELDMDPARYYKLITGASNPKATAIDCVVAMYDKYGDATQNEGGLRYRFVKSPILDAVQAGAIIEIMEANIILRDGVLTILNSLLDDTESISLPDGSILKWHPNTLMAFTINTQYSGCKPINGAVMSRIKRKYAVETLPDEEIAERIASRTGLNDTAVLTQMLQVYHNMQALLTKYRDSSCGMREMEAWAEEYLDNGGNLVEAATPTIIGGMTQDSEFHDEIRATALGPIFQGVTI